MASSILTLINPKRYGVIDIRVWEVMFTIGTMKTNPKGINFNFKQWYRYLVILRYFAGKLKVKARDIERTLFLVHQKNQEVKLYANLIKRPLNHIYFKLLYLWNNTRIMITLFELGFKQFQNISMIIEINKKDPQAHKKFQDWRRNNQNGFIINIKSPTNAMLHHTICMHLGDTEWQATRINWGSMGNSTKICSEHKRELIQWGNENLKIKLKFCGSCNP